MAWSTVTESDALTCDGDFEFFVASGQAIAIELNPGESGTFVFNVDAAGTTDDVEIEVIQGHRISNGNGLDGATSASDVELNTVGDPIANDDDLNGTYLIMTSGDEAGEGKLIVDSVAADDGVNLENALSGIPSASETYALYRGHAQRYSIDMSAAIGDDAQHNLLVPFEAQFGRYVLARARSTGGTDAHRVRASHQIDGVSA